MVVQRTGGFSNFPNVGKFFRLVFDCLFFLEAEITILREFRTCSGNLYNGSQVFDETDPEMRRGFVNWFPTLRFGSRKGAGTVKTVSNLVF